MFALLQNQRPSRLFTSTPVGSNSVAAGLQYGLIAGTFIYRNTPVYIDYRGEF